MEHEPRRLRLDQLLRELGATTDTPPPDRPTTITVGALVDHAAGGGFPFLVGILALIAIPFVGLSTPFGLAIALVGMQMVAGQRQPWLPARARRRPLSMTMLDRVAKLLQRRVRWLVRATRPRATVLVRPRIVGVGILLLALALALPLPIPGSNLVFLVPLFVYAIGLLERDGVWIAVGHAMLLVDLALLFAFGRIVWEVVRRIGAWIF